MQVKIPNEDESPTLDKCRTSSVYISQPSASNGRASDLSNNVDSGSGAEQKPVLTIQVNQDNPTMNQSTSNLVNIVSCFRAYPTITHGGIENVVHSNSAPFSVSVNRNNFNYVGSNKSDESVNNENNQNIVNVEASSKNHANASSKPAIKREDLNEIRVDQSLISEQNVSSGNVDYQNMALDSVTNRDQAGLIGAELEKIVIATTEGSSANLQQTTESIINQTAVAGGVESTDNRVSNNNCAKSESQTQTFREQRRRERRERRQARQRAQHGHHHAPAPVHQRLTTGIRMVNGAEPSRTSYEALPDILNNHLPPPYTTLPIQMPAPLHSPLAISPVPVVVDDCRFSFPIPIIRRSPSEHSGRKGCCGHIFQSPKSLGLIAVLALGGVACSLGGAAWGASGLAGPPSSHVTISLLMIGIGVVLVTISGVAWRVSNSNSSHCLGLEGTEFDHCGRQQCSNSMSHGLLYPEFQHRPPPPSYQSSMQEYRLRLLLLDRDRQSHGRRIAAAVAAAQQSASPPPTYRSNIGSQLRSHRSTVLGNNASREVSNIFTELTGMISSNQAATSPVQQACNNRLNAVPSNEGNYHNSSNNSRTQLSSSLSAVHTSIQAPTITTTQISQGKSRLSINHSVSDDDFGRRRANEISSHPTKDAASSQLSFIANVSGGNGVNHSDDSHRNSHENGMVTIVTINSLGGENGNSIV